MKAPDELLYDSEASLRLVDNAKYRIATPPVEYDDKGNIKKYTAKELAALRGTGGLPGYTADKDQLRVGKIFEVYLAGTGTKGPARKKDDDELLAAPNRPEVVMVLILQEFTK